MLLGQIDEYAAIIREMIRHEDNVINHRLTWLCQIQGLLFTAFGVSFLRALDYNHFLDIIIFLGIFISISSAASIYIANEAIKKIRSDWKDRHDKFCTGPEALYPEVFGFDADKKRENAKEVRSKLFWRILPIFFPWKTLPYIFLVVWLFIAFEIYVYIPLTIILNTIMNIGSRISIIIIMRHDILGVIFH